MNPKAKQFYEFGPYRIDSAERLLLRDGQVIPMTPKVFDTLLVFVENNCRILGKDEAMKMVWPDTTVEEANLTRNVSVLRKALGETPDQKQYIETIPWRGYRFVASVREVWDEIEEERSATAPLVVERDISAPVQQAVPDDFFKPEIKAKARKRLLTLMTAVMGAVLIAVLFAYSLSDARRRSERTGAAIDSIMKRFAPPLTLNLTGEEEERFRKKHTASAEAYQAYLKGRFWWSKRSREGFERAIKFYEEAIALDRNYALPYAGLADCYLLMSTHNLTGRKETYPKARAAATQALALDSRLAEAHASLAHITWLYDWNFPAAEAEFKRSLRYDPDYATAHQWYSVFLSSMGRHEEAIAEAKRARELDPLSLSTIQDLARAYFHAKRYDESISTSFEALDLNPQYCRLNSWLEMAYAQKGLYDRAIETRLNAMTTIGFETGMIASLRSAYAASGWKGFWQKDLKFEMSKTSPDPAFAYLAARSYARLGENDRAIEWLEKGFSERMDHLVLLNVDPIFDPLRRDPRLSNLLRRIGFERRDQAFARPAASDHSLNGLASLAFSRFDLLR